MSNDEALKTAILLLRDAVNLAVGAGPETGRSPHNILYTIARRHAEGVDWGWPRFCLPLITMNCGRRIRGGAGRYLVG